ncbi:MAG: DUF983 domain-containing protein [Fulvivirga sp.]|nr:DUF983 domain-containing protein [Fulvivirga sp.]
MQKSSSINAILSGKCPKCRQGDIFPSKTYDLKGFSKMNEKCSVCDLRFEVEPGFFYGAMYISYAFSVAILVIIGILLAVFLDPPVWVYMTSVSLAVRLLLPFTFRYSRILLLYWFGGIHFDPKYSN